MSSVLARLEFQLATDHVELVALRLLKVPCMRPVAATVGQGWIQHGLEQLVADIVMALADPECAPRRLMIDQPAAGNTRQCAEQHAQPRQGAHLFADTCPVEPGEHAVELLTVPQPVHIGLAESQ
jgi:hypothetical protein